MPSPKHEGLVQLFRNRITLAVEILRDILGVRVPAHTSVREASANLSEPVPPEHHADHVVVLEDAEGKAVLGIIVEVQLGRDRRKRFSWPAYQNVLRAQLQAPACLVVIAPSPSVASWAASPIRTGQPGSDFSPLVLGPSLVPRLADPKKTCGHPELAVLSTFAHGRGTKGLEVALAAIEALLSLDIECATVYHDLILTAVDAATRKALEEIMATKSWEPQSDFARKHYGRGFQEGEVKGLSEGKAEGRSEGIAEGKAESVLALLAARGIKVSPKTREQILACRDIPTLDGWVLRAANASSLEDVLG